MEQTNGLLTLVGAGEGTKESGIVGRGRGGRVYWGLLMQRKEKEEDDEEGRRDSGLVGELSRC